MTMEALTIGIAINRNWRDLYEEFYRPEAFALWATGMSNSALQHDGKVWAGQGTQGPIRVRFSPCNELGVLDHWVTLEGGEEIAVPLRVLANGDGAEVILTLFRQPGVDDATFALDEEWVRKDLATLKEVAEFGQSPGRAAPLPQW